MLLGDKLARLFLGALVLAIKNPLTFDAAGHNWERLMGDAYTAPKLSAHDLVDQALSEGRDGIVLMNVVDPAWGFAECLIPATTYIILSDDQVRPWHEAELWRVSIA